MRGKSQRLSILTGCAAGIGWSQTSIPPRRISHASEKGEKSRLQKKDQLPHSICKQENTNAGTESSASVTALHVLSERLCRNK